MTPRLAGLEDRLINHLIRQPWPLVARAQEPGRVYRRGGLTPSPRDAPHYAVLFDELRRSGFIESPSTPLVQP